MSIYKTMPGLSVDFQTEPYETVFLDVMKKTEPKKEQLDALELENQKTFSNSLALVPAFNTVEKRLLTRNQKSFSSVGVSDTHTLVRNPALFTPINVKSSVAN